MKFKTTKSWLFKRIEFDGTVEELQEFVKDINFLVD